MKLKIIGIGEVVWDEFNGSLVLGGAPLNFAHFARQLGAQSYIISAVGNDELGEKALNLVGQIDVDKSYIQVNELPTGVVHAEQVPDTDVVNYQIYENVAWDALQYDPSVESLFVDADAVCWGSLVQRTSQVHKNVLKMLEHVPDSCLKVFDINLRQHYYSKEVVLDSLKVADVLKLNETEIRDVAGLLQLDESLSEEECVMEIIRRYDLKFVIYTLGSVRSEIYSQKGKVSEIPTPKVDVVDTVGAGDSFTASFITSMLQGKEVIKSHEIAVKVAAFVCTQKGAINPLPSSVLELIKG